MIRRSLVAALAVGTFAFVLYRATLLPGLDFGDTGSFQATARSSIITPRDGYPLYFAIGKLLVRITGSEPAHTLNLASAIEASLAASLIVLVATELSASLLAGMAVGLLFVGSYTFWSQAIIAEVYALHILFVALALLLLLRWAKRPSVGRLTLFFAVYALGFGNHLSMILLAPAFILFLFTSAPQGWRSMLRPRIVAIALLCACAGALQYVWNLQGLWLLPQPPHDLVDAVQRFWFDVTKVDWRETMVMRVPTSVVGNRTAMYVFDLTQQFGWIGPALAALGIVHLAATDWRRALLMVTLYGVNVSFAYSYNVGDAHVFYLPSHLMVALLAAPGVVFASSGVHTFKRTQAAATLLAIYACLKIYDNYPALDRNEDDRPTRVLNALTAGLADRQAIVLTDLNWQLENGLTYFAKQTRPEVAHGRMPDVALYAPALVRDNTEIGRDVALTETARTTVEAAYGPLLPTVPDTRVSTPLLVDAVRDLPAGTRYVLAVLKPTREFSIDRNDLNRMLQAAGGGAPFELPSADYVAIAGLVGRVPAVVLGMNRPFRREVDLDGVVVDIRMESWLAADTIRRMGFGQVVAARRHTLILERGVSFAAFDEAGRALHRAYAANIFAPQPRYLIRRP